MLYLTNPAQISEPRTLFTDNMWVWIVAYAALSLHAFAQKCLTDVSRCLRQLPKAENWRKSLYLLSSLRLARPLRAPCNQ